MLLSLLVPLLYLPLLALGQASNDDPRGKILYVNSPSCGSYQCHVNWHRLSTVKVNWLSAPHGHVSIHLLPQDDNSNLPPYTIAENVKGTLPKGQCDDMGLGVRCGSFSWKVPKGVKLGRYMVMVKSQDGHEGYTDTVIIKKKKSRN
ncbi:hypothetical protein ACQY0O_000967 [Thecaphora frezii]